MQEENNIISYKINTRNAYKIYRSTYNGKDFYKAQINCQSKDGKDQQFYVNLYFSGIEPPDDRRMIVIKKAIENWIPSKIDKYNFVVNYTVFEYEYYKTEEELKNASYKEYNSNINEEIEIGDNFLDN